MGESPLMSSDGNHSNTTHGEDGWTPGAEGIIVPIMFSLIFVLGSIGNVLVIIVILRKRRRGASTSSNVFMINLAIADLMFLLFCIPFHAVIYTIPDWPFGNAMCKSSHFLQYAGMMASILTLVAMAIDRFLAVTFPIRRKFSQSFVLVTVTCVVIWLVAIAVASPWTVFYKVKVYEQHGNVRICADDWGSRKPNRPIYFIILFIIGYAIPLFAILTLSALTLYNLWAGKTPTRTNQREGVNNKRKATRLVIALVLIFALCWLPCHVMWLWASYPSGGFTNNYVFYYLRIVGLVMSYANSMLNPLVYAFISQNFRRAFIRSLACRSMNRQKYQETTRVSTYADNATMTRSTNDFEYHAELELDPDSTRRSLKMKIMSRNSFEK